MARAFHVIEAFLKSSLWGNLQQITFKFISSIQSFQGNLYLSKIESIFFQFLLATFYWLLREVTITHELPYQQLKSCKDTGNK